MRSCLRFSFLLLFSIVMTSPLRAQINGVPASVTSYGFGGSNNPNPGVRSSVTSLGPDGFSNRRPVFGSCCTNFFLPPTQNPSFFFGHQHPRRHRREDRSRFALGAYGAAFTPYPVPYDVPYADEADDDPPDLDYAIGTRRPDPQAKLDAKRSQGPKPTVDSSAITEPQDPVASQPATVLIFKDGHQADVVNYAIVGGTLFDFSEGRTRKILLVDLNLPATRNANDNRGVDFQIPANIQGQ